MPVFRKDGRNVLFIHVPKTGGSSLERTFVDNGWTMHYHDGRMGPKSLNRVRRCTPQHMHAPMLRQLFLVKQFDLVFMTVREPIARFRSEYGMRNKDGAVDERTVERWADDVFDRYARNPFLFDNHLRPQAEFQLDAAEVYPLEDGLDTIVRRLSDKHDLGLAPAEHRVHDRKSRSGFSSSDVQISGKLETRLRKFYADDFKKYGY